MKMIEPLSLKKKLLFMNPYWPESDWSKRWKRVFTFDNPKNFYRCPNCGLKLATIIPGYPLFACLWCNLLWSDRMNKTLQEKIKTEKIPRENLGYYSPVWIRIIQIPMKLWLNFEMRYRYLVYYTLAAIYPGYEEEHGFNILPAYLYHPVLTIWLLLHCITLRIKNGKE